MLLKPGVVIFLALVCVLPVFAEGRIILDEGYTNSVTIEEIEDYTPSEAPRPAFMINIVGGKGFIVTITNIGGVKATNTTCNVSIEGGLFMTPKVFSASEQDLDIGQNFTVIGATKGIGLGILIPIPTIKIIVNCTEGVSVIKAVQATIFFSMVTLL
jgi:hypothetical protein